MNIFKSTVATWTRKPGTPEDVWEAHTALEHLEEIARRDNAAYEAEAARLSYTARERAENLPQESPDFIRTNRTVAETMSYISAWQEWRVRAAVAAGEPAPEPL